MRKQAGWVFRKHYTHRAVVLRKQQRLETVIDALVDRWIEKHDLEVTADGKLQTKSRQIWPPMAN